ncbi:MAG: hypothetical protein ACR2F8_00620 [Caulobacteraceae bacterium]
MKNSEIGALEKSAKTPFEPESAFDGPALKLGGAPGLYRIVVWPSASSFDPPAHGPKFLGATKKMEFFNTIDS